MTKPTTGPKKLENHKNKRLGLRHLLLAAAAIAPAAAQAQFPADRNEWIPPGKETPDPPLQPPLPHKPNRFGVSARLGFNISAEFKNSSPFPGQPNPGPPTGNGINRFYDDGFVRPDETFPNNGGLTFFWGYDNPSQVTATDIFFHRADSAFDDAGKQNEDDIPFGMELTYARELGANGWGTWGLEAGFAFTDLEIRSNGVEDGQVRLLTDRYSLGNPPIIVPPPSDGTFDGVNRPSIGDVPDERTITTVPATIDGRNDLIADIYTLRLGPYFTFPLSRRSNFQFGVGLATAIVDSTYRFEEATTTFAGTVNRRGKGDDTDYLLGAYGVAQLTHQFSNNLGVFGGVQFQTFGDSTHEVAGKKAKLDLGAALFAHIGVSVSFK